MRGSDTNARRSICAPAFVPLTTCFHPRRAGSPRSPIQPCVYRLRVPRRLLCPPAPAAPRSPACPSAGRTRRPSGPARWKTSARTSLPDSVRSCMPPSKRAMVTCGPSRGAQRTMCSTSRTASVSRTSSCQRLPRKVRVEQATRIGASIASPARSRPWPRRIASSQPVRHREAAQRLPGQVVRPLAAVVARAGSGRTGRASAIGSDPVRRRGRSRARPTRISGRRTSHGTLKSKNGLFRKSPSTMPWPLRECAHSDVIRPPVEWPGDEQLVVAVVLADDPGRLVQLRVVVGEAAGEVRRLVRRAGCGRTCAGRGA